MKDAQKMLVASAAEPASAAAPPAPAAPVPLPLTPLLGPEDLGSEGGGAEGGPLDRLRPADGGQGAIGASLAARNDRYSATLFSQAVQTDGPMVPQAKPEQKSWASKAFDLTKAQQDVAALAVRVQKYPMLAKSDFIAHMQAYVDGAGAGDDVVAEQGMRAAIAELSRLNAFTIGSEVYVKQGEDVDADTLAELADKAMNGVVLWSKLNKYQAIETVAGGEKGNSLEASTAGSLFDDLTFGMDYGSHAVLRKQWSLVSESFVTHAQGEVHAQVLEGIDPNSVLTTIEWPIISKLMYAGQVYAFVVHFFEYEESKEDPSAPGKLVEIGQRSITHPRQWMTLPSVTEWNEELSDYSATQSFNAGTGKQEDSGYKKRQNTAHTGENERHKRLMEARAKVAAEPARFVATD